MIIIIIIVIIICADILLWNNVEYKRTCHIFFLYNIVQFLMCLCVCVCLCRSCVCVDVFVCNYGNDHSAL